MAAVSASGSSVTITAVATGSATIHVTATDPGGLSAMRTFQAAVPNRAPEPTGAIPGQTVFVGETATVDVSTYFADPDGDALSYGASSSDPSVAVVAVSGSEVTIRAVSQGSTTITVTATDPGGLSAMQTFEATVLNRAPEPTSAVPDLSIHVGESATVDISSHFADPDGDVLSYGASSSDPSVAVVAVSGSEVTIRAVSQGSTTITVTATDPGGLSAMQTFEATVLNRAPEPTSAVPDLSIHVGESATVDISSHFADPDGDVLSYGASSSDPSVAVVAVSGSEVTINAVFQGSTTITVTATDPGGLTTTQSSGVTVMPSAPDLVFTTVSPASATLTPGDSVTFTFGIRNRGTVVSGATTIRAMRSSNPIVSARDTELRSWSFSSLAPSQDRTLPLTISVGAGSAPGTIYIGMCVDPVTDESNTRNNCSEGARLAITSSSIERAPVGGHRSAIRIRTSRPPAGEPGGGT